MSIYRNGKSVSFTIQNALIPVDSGYETADVQVVNNCISAIAQNSTAAKIVIKGKNKLRQPGLINAHTDYS
ncbi:hypothetical protein QUA40_12745 [Microcoleus sp. Pol11C3]|uniref:hypothetical protein n=1 Tax=Microcoleus sp. Pol11C3 TaxID=3055390 RepID=UPI002FD76E50